MRLREIVEQLESCGYECEAGPLSMNTAFIALKEMCSRPPAIDRERGWVSVENRLPERGVGVLITDGEDMVTAQRLCVGPAKTFTQDNAFWAGYGYGGYDCESEVHEPTHWMPLPATPTEPKE